MFVGLVPNADNLVKAPAGMLDAGAVAVVVVVVVVVDTLVVENVDVGVDVGTGAEPGWHWEYQSFSLTQVEPASHSFEPEYPEPPHCPYGGTAKVDVTAKAVNETRESKERIGR